MAAPRRWPGWVSDLIKAAAVVVFAVVWTKLYAAINAAGVASPRALSFTPPLERTPWLFGTWAAIVYVFGGGLSLVLPFFWHWRGRRFARLLTAYALASAAAFTAYLIWPMTIARPAFQGSGLGPWLMRNVIAVDDASNLNPSTHTIFAVILALALWDSRAKGWIKAAATVLAAAICVSTIAVGQHYYGDVAGGTATALAAYFAAKLLIRERPGRNAAP
jgi:membrane-associated phospholipid phosphatase